jgi:phosphoserine phosphatase RsbU/P
LVGGIVLWHRHARNFSPQVITFIQALAQQCVHAVENVRLFEAEARRRSEAETLYTVTQALSATLDLPRVFVLILSELHKVLPYDSASVQQLQGDQLVIIGGRGFPSIETFYVTLPCEPSV